MNKKIFLILWVFLGAVAFLFLPAISLVSDDQIHDSKKNCNQNDVCSCIKTDPCASFFCECLPLFKAFVPSTSGAIFLIPGINFTFNTIPFNQEGDGSFSSGKIASICPNPIFGCNGKVNIPGNRIQLCKKCGWIKITFVGTLTLDSGIVSFAPNITFKLKSICGLPDIVLFKTDFKSDLSKISFINRKIYIEEIVDLNQKDNCCLPHGYYLQIEGSRNSSGVNAFIYSLDNASVLIEADGPCGCCSSSKGEE